MNPKALEGGAILLEVIDGAGWRPRGKGKLGVEIGFEREAFCTVEPESEDGYLDVKVTGWLLTGQRFEGADTIKIINQHWRHRHEKRFRERPAKRMIGNQQEPAAGRGKRLRRIMN
ncbi:MAG: hypothetical protein JSW23_10620 [Planctomycetota bacterium]|nr:MAG: hypothetical protein JSW23_10620 [Planctomycetota bacterium]